MHSTGTAWLVETKDSFFCRLAVCTNQISNYPWDRVLTYKNLMYLLNFQFSRYVHCRSSGHVCAIIVLVFMIYMYLMYLCYRHDQALPAFLSVYTAGAVYTRVLSQGVELFQFKKQYTDAVQQLKELIQQETYHLDYRGRWYERLVLNLDHHLKKPSEVSCTLVKFLMRIEFYLC